MPVLTNTNQKPNSLPKMPGDTGYSLGFFCGCFVGAVGTYLAFTPEGKLLKQKILKEFQANQQAIMLAQVLPPDESTPPSPLLVSVKHAIDLLRHRLNPSSSLKLNLRLSDRDLAPKRKHYFKKK